MTGTTGFYDNIYIGKSFQRVCGTIAIRSNVCFCCPLAARARACYCFLSFHASPSRINRLKSQRVVNASDDLVASRSSRGLFFFHRLKLEGRKMEGRNGVVRRRFGERKISSGWNDVTKWKLLKSTLKIISGV